MTTLLSNTLVTHEPTQMYYWPSIRKLSTQFTAVNFIFICTANGLICNGTVAFLSTDSCSTSVVQGMAGAPTPVIRVNPDVTCPHDTLSSNMVHLPRMQTLTSMLQLLAANLPWDDAMVFYDTTTGKKCDCWVWIYKSLKYHFNFYQLLFCVNVFVKSIY